MSCTNIIVAPSNLSFIASIGMEVYKSLLNFKGIAYSLRIINYGILKLWLSHSFCLVDDKVVLHNTNVWENCDFKNITSHDYMCIHFKPGALSPAPQVVRAASGPGGPNTAPPKLPRTM